MDVQDCATVFDGFFAKDKAKKVILMYDVIYAHCVGKDHLVSKDLEMLLWEESCDINSILNFHELAIQ